MSPQISLRLFNGSFNKEEAVSNKRWGPVTKLVKLDSRIVMGEDIGIEAGSPYKMKLEYQALID
jgi:hypothetical protein